MINRYLALLLALPALAACVGIAGCGSDEAAEASLTKKQFQKKANLICSNASNEQFKKANEYLEKHPKATEADVIEPAGIPPLEKQLEELKELSAPSGFEDEVQAYLDAFEAALEELKADPEALSPQDNPFAEANKLGEKYKLGDCKDSP